MAAVSIIPAILDYFSEDIVRNQILPKTKSVYKQNGGDVKIVLAVLACISKILNKMDKMVIIEEVLPILFEVKLTDVNVLIRVLGEFCTVVPCRLSRPHYNTYTIRLIIKPECTDLRATMIMNLYDFLFHPFLLDSFITKIPFSFSSDISKVNSTIHCDTFKKALFSAFIIKKV